LGIVIHSTAGHIDPGFRGKIVLEMENIRLNPVLLYPKIRICQLVFESLMTPTTMPYYKKKNAKYVDAKHPQESKLEKE
jgi:dCTP deaminase